MFFRPSFCANCGEKIERTDWGVATSRRFCQVCESEFKGQDLIPRVIVGLGILMGIFGFGSYLNAGRTEKEQIVSQPKRFVERVAPPQPIEPNVSNDRQETAPVTTGSEASNRSLPQPAANQVTAATAVQPPVVEKSVPIYFCGAETKKGTPCSRKVKGNVRCFQHTGMPAMLPPEKLRVN